MHFSADILPDDHRNYIVFLDERDGEGRTEDRTPESAHERILTLLAVVAFAGFVPYFLYSKGLNHWIQHPIYFTLLVFGLLFACLCLGATWELRRWDGDRLDHNALREGLNLGEVRFDLRPEGLGVTFSLVQDLYGWQSFQDIEDGPEAFYLILPYGDDIIVPKRAFANDAAREHFKELAGSRIGGRA